MQKYLKERDIATEVYYPVPLHLQQCFAYLGHHAGRFSRERNRRAGKRWRMPVYPELTADQAQYVVDCVAAFLREKSSRPSPLVGEGSGVRGGETVATCETQTRKQLPLTLTLSRTGSGNLEIPFRT